MRFWTYLQLTFHVTKSNIMSEMEYRLSFLTKIFAMMLNDFGLFSLWIIFFARFPNFNGWNLRESMLLQGLLLSSFSLFAVFTAGTLELSKIITRGQLDYFLALPKNALWHVSVSRTEVAAIGDFIFGVGLFIFAGQLTVYKILLFCLLVPIAALTLYAFATAVQCLAFFFGDFEESADRWFWTLFGFSLYPQSVFSGSLKVLMMVFVPVYFTAALPTSLLNSFSLKGLSILFGVALVAWALLIVVFKAGVKKYESGNLLDARV